MSYESYLAHHGVLGMRWGVRRYQNPDGSLKAAGRKRYLDGTKNTVENVKTKVSTGLTTVKSKYEKRNKKFNSDLKRAYMSKGLSEEEASKKVANRDRVRKTLAVVGAVAVAAAISGYAYRKYQGQVDHILKQGTSIQRIEFANDPSLHDTFYAAINKHDKTKYAGLLGKTRQLQFGKAYKMGIGVNQNVKVAGNKSAFKIFKDVYKNNKEFRDTIGNRGNISDKDLKKLYERFNKRIVDPNFARNGGASEAAYKAFQKAVIDKGYGGVLDVNDMKFSGYNAHAPAILFNTGKEYTINTFDRMDDKEINRALIKDTANIETVGRILGFTGLYGAAGMYVNDINNITLSKKQKQPSGGKSNVKKK